MDAEARRERLVEVYREAIACTRCPLSDGRTNVVFGNGNANADLMFVGEAPGAEEDRRGLPFVGRAGKLLDDLLGGIDLTRDDVFVGNVLKCLRYTAQVQLGDGTWERIGRLVRSRYGGEVMSVDSDGRLVPRRVIGWHATPVGGRSVYRLTYRSAKHVGIDRVNIEVTGDHRVLTPNGYVAVQDLEPGGQVATGQGLTPVAFDVVCGTLLGDGSLNRNSAHLTIAHAASQAEYARFKAELLDELDPQVSELEVAAVAGGARQHRAVHVRTHAHRALGVLRQRFYGSEKVVPEALAEGLNERMLAIWFLDDGYMRIRPPRQPSAEIATVGFADRDLQVLLRGLQRLGLSAKASQGRLYFSVVETRKLSEAIAPYVPPSMRYKLHPDVECRVAFDPGRWRNGPPEVLYDEVDVQDVTERERPDTTFFCIDVEETSNFVTSGGVVHNCRPPGNRDPEPEEIASCRPYLDRQIELIEPRVVATLGNFATKLLTASRTGITRVRGTPQVHTLAGRTVFVMPLLHPAAALRTASLVETLREDFAKLPGLVAADLPESDGPEASEASGHGDPEDASGGEPDRADQLDLFA